MRQIIFIINQILTMSRQWVKYCLKEKYKYISNLYNGIIFEI